MHLYRLVDGIGVSSQALHAAAQGGVQKPTLERYRKAVALSFDNNSLCIQQILSYDPSQ